MMRSLLAATLLSVFIWQFVYAQTPPCGECTNNSTEPITHVPPPWTLTATVFAVPIIPLTSLDFLPSKAYAPLEKDSTATAGTFVGLVGAIMIIRYSETPVGPYDEFLIIPGFWDYPRTYENGTTEIHTKIRGSRFYVSQKYTNYNGRVNWNIPKHLAKFDWIEADDGSTSVKIYPFDTDNQPEEDGPSPLPFFQMTFTPLTPNPLQIPVSTDIFTYLGLSPLLGQAPLPAGNGSYNELPGTTQWAETALGMTSDYPTPGVMNLDQHGGDEVGNSGFNAVGDEYFPNFWPGLTTLNVAVRLDNSTVSFPVPEQWTQ